MTGPTPQEQAERVLQDTWARFNASPKAGSPFVWQAAALVAAGLLPPQAEDAPPLAEALRGGVTERVVRSLYRAAARQRRFIHCRLLVKD